MATMLDERIAAEPFAAWLKKKTVELGGPQAVAELLQTTERRVYSYANCLKSGSVDGVKGEYPTDTFARARVEDMLDHAGVRLWEIPGYEDLEPDDAFHDAFCPTCHEMVTVGDDDVCPWCETPTEAGRRAQLHCPRCNRLVFPTPAGDCWRCGEKAMPIPWGPCECGCGTQVRLIDRHGRPVSYVRGHAPRALENAGTVAAEPFAQYLERELKQLDVIGALARAHGIAREDVVAVLRREVDEVPRETVRRALWVAARGGTTGKGAPPRPGAVGFFDLYPDDRRARVCPGCGNGKAPHAEFCKPCRRRKKAQPQPPTAVTRLSDAAIEEAYRLYVDEGLSLLAVAERMLDRTPNRSAEGLSASLSREWKRRGWELRARRRAA